MPEGMEAIVEKLSQLPEEELTAIIEALAAKLGIVVESEEEDAKEEAALKQLEGGEEQAKEIEEEGKEPTDEEVNPQDLIAKVAF